MKAFLWGIDLVPFVDLVEQALEGYDRSAPFDLLSFPPDSAERFIDDEGILSLTHNDVAWIRLGDSK
jgi:hypothetical protein